LERTKEVVNGLKKATWTEGAGKGYRIWKGAGIGYR
jgi:hypothetical protein